MTKISELKAGASNVTVEGTVAEKDKTREVTTKYGKRLNVANITLKDDSGRITMSLWGNDIGTVNVGDKIRIVNGYVSEFRGTPQISAGKFGKIEIIEKGKGGEELKETEEDSGQTQDDFGGEEGGEDF